MFELVNICQRLTITDSTVAAFYFLFQAACMYYDVL